MFLYDTLPTSDTVTVELTYKGKTMENDDKTPMTIEAYLPHTKEYKAAMHERVDASFEKERKEEYFKAAELEQVAVDFMAKTTRDWNISVSAKEQNVKFSVKKAKEVYAKYPFIMEQVRREVEKAEDFI